MRETSPDGTRPDATRIGYLTNVYPSVSHSFIRREIQALERRGIAVTRFTIRRAGMALPDPADQAEAARTIGLLEQTPAFMLGAILLILVAAPWRVPRALGLAIAMGRAGAAGVVRHLIYLVEACVLVRLSRRGRIRHVHVHFGTNPATVARLARALGGPGYSMTVHGPDEFDAPVAWGLPEKMRDAAFTVAISDYGRAQLMRWAPPADWAKISVIRCGLDETFLRDPADDAGDAGEADGEGEANGVNGAANADDAPSAGFVCVARLAPQKGLPLLLDAAALVAGSHDFRLTVIGDGPLRGELERQIAALGLEGRVSLPGWQSAAAIRQALLGARALVLASFAEGLPVVLMEALALARPVIATMIAGVPELVDQQCGWLVPAGSAPALAAAMRAALAEPPAGLRAKGRAGRARVLRDHDADVNAAPLADLLAGCGRRGGRALPRPARAAGRGAPARMGESHTVLRRVGGVPPAGYDGPLNPEPPPGQSVSHQAGDEAVTLCSIVPPARHPARR